MAGIRPICVATREPFRIDAKYLETNAKAAPCGAASQILRDF
jgi:hypothetical protein